MRLAIIDLGTNSIRFDIHEISTNRSGAPMSRRLYREKTMVRLGQNLFLQGKLSEESKRRVLEAVIGFRDTMDALEVDKVLAFGTAAMRDASDGESFLAEIKKTTDIDFRIISGNEEAALIAQGVLANDPNLPKGLFALIDIGGGSTEISICRGNKILHSHSFNLGVAKLQQVFLKRQPPVKDKKHNPVLDLRTFIKSIVLPQAIIEHWPKVGAVVGSSGSVIALAKLVNRDRDNGNRRPFLRKDLTKTVASIQTKTAAELLSMRGMEPKRVDLILAGGILLDELMQIMGAKVASTTEFALRDGILESELARFTAKKSRSPFSFEDIEKRVQKWGLDLPHMQRVQSHAENLFDVLKSVHKLKAEWRPYLSAAALLHDAGEIVSHAHHAEHSEYIVKNANFVGMDGWEAELISKLCRFHKEEKILEKKNEKKIPYSKSSDLREVFLKLLALLQIADSLDRTHKEVLKLRKPKVLASRVELKFSSKTPCDLEMLRFDQKKALFEDLFKRPISLTRVSR
jgi:exopolyphosphatase/guanosine-5'-triphosphate,3'-diphosphate pyrophosphatase